MRSFFVTIIISTILLLNYSCQKEFVQSSNNLCLSTDTLKFDTLIVGLLSETQSQLKIYNRSNENVAGVSLMVNDGNSSSFMINANGVSGKSISNLRINKKDSLYVFVQFKLSGSANKDPFFYQYDSLTMASGNYISKTILEVPVINANYIEGTSENFSLESGQAYFIKSDLIVPENKELFIPEGCEIYINNGASIIVNGSLNAKGTVDKPIIFRGIRYGNITSTIKYDYVPGQWEAIYIKPSSQISTLDFCHIRNAQRGLTIGLPSENNTQTALNIFNSKIQYNSDYNILAYNANLKLVNVLLSNAQQSLGIMGGELEVINTTIANYFEWGNGWDEAVSIGINDIDNIDNETVYELESCEFINTIIYGGNSSEVLFDLSGDDYKKIQFENCNIKVSSLNEFIETKNLQINQNPVFKSTTPFNYDFHLNEESSCINQGTNRFISLFPYDIDGFLRDDNCDIGAYEYVYGDD